MKSGVATNMNSEAQTMNKLEAALKKMRIEAIELLLKIKHGLEDEADQTKEMVLTYLRFSQGEASQEEMSKANEQFRSFLKTIGFGALAILPFAPLTIPAIVSVGKKFGIDVIPKSFRKIYDKEHQKTKTETSTAPEKTQSDTDES